MFFSEKETVMEPGVGRTRATFDGFYTEDQSGLWHYHYGEGLGTMFDAAKDAITHHPGHASWFWLNGTFCPILLGDDIAKLVERWAVWRIKIQGDPKSLLALLQELASRATEEPKPRYWLSVSGLPWQEATLEQFVSAEQSAGFYPPEGQGPVATESFGSKGIEGRVTRGEITVENGYNEEFVRIANQA